MGRFEVWHNRSKTLTVHLSIEVTDHAVEETLLLNTHAVARVLGANHRRIGMKRTYFSGVRKELRAFERPFFNSGNSEETAKQKKFK